MNALPVIPLRSARSRARVAVLLTITFLVGAVTPVPGAGATHDTPPDVPMDEYRTTHDLQDAGYLIVTFDLEPDHDLRVDLDSWVFTGTAFTESDERPLSNFHAFFTDEALLYWQSGGAAYSPGFRAYAKLDGEGAEENVTFPGGGMGIWEHHAFGHREPKLDGVTRVHALFGFAAPQAHVWLNATWSRGVTIVNEHVGAPEDVVAWTRADFPRGVAAGADGGLLQPSGGLFLDGNVTADHGLVGWFFPLTSFGVAHAGCASPTNADSCFSDPDAAEDDVFFGREPGAWNFHIDASVETDDWHYHLVLAFKLPSLSAGA